MGYLNPFLRSLLEAPQGEDNEEENPEEQNQEQENDEAENPDQDAQDNQTEEGDQENQDEPEDPFADDNAEGEEQEDLSNPPDGLESPDATDDGTTTDNTEGEADEQNIQLAILPLSKLDRLTLKRKCFDNFRNLRSMINRVSTLISDNEQLLQAEFRESMTNELAELYNAVSGYMTTKFGFNNYEENAKNYNIFAAQLDELLKNLQKDDNYDI